MWGLLGGFPAQNNVSEKRKSQELDREKRPLTAYKLKGNFSGIILVNA